MSKLPIAFIIITLSFASSVQAAQPPAPAGSPNAAAPIPAQMSAPRHLVYEFGYNTKAASQGPSTGTTTVDIEGVAKDGGMKVVATDSWWNSTNPKQSSNCEVYANGNVTCGKPPYNLTGIQATVLPLLGQQFFASLAGSLTSSWNANFEVRASFAPSVNRGFGGQVYTWNGAYSLTGKGTLPEQPPLILVASNGTLKQQGGRFVTVNQKSNVLFDPRIKTPVFVDASYNIVPRQSTNNYTVQLKLVKY
ncbi:MAG TPA: hypothetical protein VFF60_04710 [Candidatus Binatus sp.]|nr:hypothetical protein [Candidatus Binatus sp.]